MDDLVSAELAREKVALRQKLGEFAGVRLDKCFTGAQAAGLSRRRSMTSKRLGWRMLKGSTEKSRNPNDAIRLALNKFATSRKSKSSHEAKAFRTVADVLAEFFPAPETCPLATTSIQLLLSFLEKWVTQIYAEKLLDDDVAANDYIDTARAAGIVIEAVSRSAQDALTKEVLSGLGNVTETAIMTVTANLQRCCAEIERLESAAASEERKQVCRLLCSWLVLGVCFVPHSLIAQSNIEQKDAPLAFEVMRVYASLPAPLGHSRDALEHVEAALAVIRSNVSEERYRPEKKLSEASLALFVVSGLSRWEVTLMADVKAEKPTTKGDNEKVGFLKREALSCAGFLASDDENLAKLLTERTESLASTIEALAFYEGSSGDFARNVLEEMLNGIAEFIWYIAEVDPGTPSSAGDAAVQLLKRVGGCLKTEYGNLLLIQVLDELLKRGGHSAYRPIKQSGVMDNYLRQCVTIGGLYRSNQDALGDHFFSFADAAGRDVAKEFKHLLQLICSIPQGDLDHYGAMKLLVVFASQFVNIEKRLMREILEVDPVGSLMELAVSLLKTSSADEIEGDEVLGSASAPQSGRGSEPAVARSAGAELLESIMININPLLGTPLSVAFALHSETVLSCFPKLLRKPETISLAVPHIVSIIGSSSQVSTADGSRRGESQSDSRGWSAEELDQRKKLFFRCLMTEALNMEDPIMLIDLLQGLAAVSASRTSVHRFDEEDRAILESSSLQDVVLRILRKRLEESKDKESLEELTKEVIRTLAVIVLHEDENESRRTFAALADELMALYENVPVSSLDLLLSYALTGKSDESWTVAHLWACHEEQREYGEKLVVRDLAPFLAAIRIGLHLKDPLMRVQLLTVVLALVNASSLNKQRCGSGGVLDMLLEAITPELEPDAAELSSNIIGSIGSFYFPVQSVLKLTVLLKKAFSPRHGSQTCVRALIDSMSTALTALEAFPEVDLTGRVSGMLASKVLKGTAASRAAMTFPPSKPGYTIAMWFRAEHVQQEFVLFSLFEDSGNAMEMSYGKGQFVLRYSGHKSQGLTQMDTSLGCAGQVLPMTWTHIAIVHWTSSMFNRTSDVDVYLNGEHVSKGSLRYPSFTGSSVHLALGFSPTTKKKSLCGQLGSFLILADLLKADQFKALNQIGPGCDTQFLNVDSTVERAVNLGFISNEARSLIDARLADKILVNYNSIATEGIECPDNSPGGASGARPAVGAQLISSGTATRVMTPEAVRPNIDALGVINILAGIFRSITIAAAKSGPGSSNCIDTFLKLLTAAIGRDIIWREQAHKFRFAEITSHFVMTTCAPNLTIQAADQAIRMLDATGADKRLLPIIASSWVANMMMWGQAAPEVQKVIFDYVLSCFDRSKDENVAALSVREALTVEMLAEAIPVVQHGDIRKLLIRIAIEVLLAGGPGEEALVAQSARKLLTLTLPTDGNEALVRDVLDVAGQVNSERSDNVARVLANCGEDVLVILLRNMTHESAAVRLAAMHLVVSICQNGVSGEYRDRLIAALGDAIMKNGVSIEAHLVLLNLVFPAQRSGASALVPATPLLLYVIAKDVDLASQATALRALVNEVLGSEDSRNFLMSDASWPKALSQILSSAGGDTTEKPDAIALEKALGSLLSVLVQHAFYNKPLGYFLSTLDAFVTSGHTEFTALALEKSLEGVEINLVQKVEEGAKLEVEYRKACYLERFAGILLCVELYANLKTEEEMQVFLPVVFKSVDLSRALSLWRRSTGLDGIRTWTTPGAFTTEEDHFADLEKIMRFGGFLRISLRLICKAIGWSRDTADEAKYTELLLEVVGAQGQTISELFLNYAKLCLHSYAAQSPTPEKAALLKKVSEAVERRWTQEQKKAFPARKAQESSMAQERAQGLFTEEKVWKDGLRVKLEGATSEAKSSYRASVGSLDKAADAARRWVADRVPRIEAELRDTELEREASLNVRESNTKKAWSVLGRNAEFHQELVTRQLQPQTRQRPVYWKLNTSLQDPIGRRCIVEMDLHGTRHEYADISRMDELALAQQKAEAEAPLQAPGGLLPKEALENFFTESAAKADDPDRFSSNVAPPTPKPPTEATEATFRGRDDADEEFNDQDDEQASESVVIQMRCKVIRLLGESTSVLEITKNSLRISQVEDESDRFASEVRGSRERVFALSSVSEIFTMRHLLQPVALEIFFKDEESVLVATDSKDARENLLKALEAQLRRICNTVRIISSMKTRQAVLRDGTTRWRKRQMSNFEYLMLLNRMAGRTYNDASQYPVFPWVLRDYHSKELDLNDPATFRDLSKPMGCQLGDDEAGEREVSKREEMFRSKFDAWEDPTGVPAFHYGSHYSSTGTVVNLLVRLEPFTTLFLQHQGGHFDYPDRMFLSVEGAWRSVSSSTQNVAELVPEAFYNPEFLRNLNNLPLGTTQDGKDIAEVTLPPWAQGSAEHFIRLHSQALESEHVSKHLANWIDLIFGYKQKGRAAVEACNVFYFLTYEGAVKLDNLDPTFQAGILEQIRHYGQTPLQLFYRGHVPRDAPAEHRAKSATVKTERFDTDLPEPIVRLGHVQDALYIVQSSRAMSNNRLVLNPDPRGDVQPFFERDPRVATDAAAGPGAAVKRGRGRCVGGAHFAPGIGDRSCAQVFALTPDGKTLIAVGFWDRSIRVQPTADVGRPRQVLKYHRDVVTCVSLDSENNRVVTGSKDCTLMIWDLRRVPDGDRIHPEEPRHILRGHVSPVTFVVLSTALGIVVSGNDQNFCIIHSLRSGKVIRYWHETISVTQAAITSEANIVLMSRSAKAFKVLTVNGVEVAHANTMSEPTVFCITRDGRFVVHGSHLGEVFIRSTWNLEVLHHSQLPTPISALELSSEENAILVGLEDGNLVVRGFDRVTVGAKATLAGLKGSPLRGLY